jgi:hypothetical protein
MRWSAEELAHPPLPERDALTGASLGFLALLPLLGCYEWAVAESGGARRNAAEMLLSLGLSGLGPLAHEARWAALAAGALAAYGLTRRRGLALGAGVARIVLEGLLAALLLGPLLVLGMALTGVGRLDVSWTPPAPPGLERAALAAGGAAYEELVFRVGCYGLVYLLARRTARALGVGAAVAAWCGEALGLAASALAFAALHFRAFAGWLFAGGRALDPASFTWLALAGMLLGILFRWRGPGVAGWCHGLFNLALLVGIDPDVLS